VIPVRPARSKRTRGAAKVAAVIGIVVVVGVVLALALPRLLARAGTAGPAGRPKGAVAVVTSTARRGDLKIYFSAPGTVVAFNTVTVRSRVDGELMSVLFDEGDIVEEGKLLAEIDSRPFEVQKQQAAAQKARDEAECGNAENQLKNFKNARDEKTGELAISQQQIDTMEATVRQLSATIQSDQAAIDAADLQILYCKIRAPISGRLGLRLVDKGNFVRAGDPSSSGLVVITQLQPIAVFFSLPQDDLAPIQSRSEAQKRAAAHGKKEPPLGVEVFDRELRRRLAAGELLTFDNQIDPATGTIRMKAVSANEHYELFPNEFVNARLLVETRKDQVLVPTAAVQRSAKSTFVYVVKPDETAITKGLDGSETVVIEGVDKLQDGAKVTLSEGAKPEKDAKPEKGAKPEKPEKRSKS